MCLMLLTAGKLEFTNILARMSCRPTLARWFAINIITHIAESPKSYKGCRLVLVTEQLKFIAPQLSYIITWRMTMRIVQKTMRTNGASWKTAIVLQTTVSFKIRKLLYAAEKKIKTQMVIFAVDYKILKIVSTTNQIHLIKDIYQRVTTIPTHYYYFFPI